MTCRSSRMRLGPQRTRVSMPQRCPSRLSPNHLGHPVSTLHYNVIPNPEIGNGGWMYSNWCWYDALGLTMEEFIMQLDAVSVSQR